MNNLLFASDYTLIIPTYNRHQLLSRLLRYCVKHYKCILVLDSSCAEVVAENQRLTATFGEVVRHRVYDSETRPVAKIYAGLLEVTTPYFSFCADDDVLFPEGVTHALEALREHPDYVGVDGIYLNFQSKEKSVHVGVEYSGCGIGAAHPVARIFSLLNRYESLFYGVFRTSEVLPVFAALNNLQSYHFQELFQSVGVLLSGKTHRLPIFFAGRQQCEPAESARDKWQTYYWFAENPEEFLEHYVAYRGELLQFYKLHSSLPRMPDEAFVRAMDLAHATFFSVSCPPRYFYQFFEQYWPNDPYQVSAEASVLSMLKSPLRRRIESKSTQLAGLLEKGVKAAAFLPWHLGSLNREIKRQVGPSYECVLPRSLAWISGDPEFRKAYKELCSYLNA